MTRPRVLFASLGGTIATLPGPGGGRVPALSGADLIRDLPGFGDRAEIEVLPWALLPGPSLETASIVDLARRIDEHLAGDCAAAVVSQGTDTIEEVAWLLDLLVTNRDSPVVVVGAMRGAGAPGADGPANLQDALATALAPAARGQGALVVLNGEIHAARFVQKVHSESPAAFASPIVGRLGFVSEATAHVPLRLPPLPRPRFPIGTQPAPVALLAVGFDDDGRLLDTVPDLGFQGAVIEAMGGGHVPTKAVERVERLAARMPVLLASRTGAGRVLTATYGFPGSEMDLIRRGVIPTGWLGARKAKLLLSLMLGAGFGRMEVADALAAIERA